MQTEPSCELPESFDRIELWAVRRQKIHLEPWRVSLPPFFVERGVVIASVVRDHHDPPPASATRFAELFHKSEKTHTVKLSCLTPEDELPVPQADRPEITNAPSRGMVEQDGILFLRRHPHPAPRPVLLKMNLVARPQVNLRVLRQKDEFFYIAVESQDLHGRSMAAACADEIPTPGTCIDIAAHLTPPYIASR